MKKVFILWVISFLLVITPGFATAQDIANRLGIGARVLYYFPQGDELLDTSGEMKDDIALGINLTYIIIPYFSLELAWDYFETDVEEGGFEWGEITTMPLMLTAQFRLLPEGPVVPYAGAGVGYYFNGFDVSAEAKQSGVSYTTDVDDSLGLHLNAGLDFFLTDNFALNLDTKYFWSETDIEGKEGSSGATVTDEIDLDSWVIGAGVKLYF